GPGRREAGPGNARVDLVQRRYVIVRLRVARLDEGNIVHVPGHMGIPVTDPGPTLSVTAKFERRFHERARVAVEHVDLNAFAVAAVKLRFRVEQVERAWRALHE